MKFSKVIAVTAASAIAVSTLAVSSFAALLETKVEESSGPKNNMWELEFTSEVCEWAPKVEKVVATVTSEEYLNGAMGGNTVKADGWAASAQCENKEAGTNEWVWDEIGGLKAGLDEEGNQIGYFKIEFWWQNAITNDDETTTPTTATVDKMAFYAADGTLLAEYPAPVTEDDTSKEEVPGECTGEVTEYVIKAGSSKEGTVNVGLEAQFDASVGTIGEWPALPTTTMTADGSDVTLTYDFSDYGKVKFGGNYVAIATDLAWEDMEAQPDLYSAANVAVKSIKLDGVEVGDVSKLCVNNEANGGKALRITLLNEWNDNFKGNAPLSGIELPEFSKVEVTFAVTDAAAKGDNSDVPPPTGVTLAVIPAVLAATGLTVAIAIKKRK